MKPRLVLVAALAAIAAFAAPPDSYTRLRELLPNPPAAYSTFPFMVWNGEVTEKEIDAFLADFHAKGIGGVFIHPRPGLITPYLSERWFALTRYAVEQGKKLGMEVWLYDENSYPSGFAGGHVPAQMPESWNEGQGLTLRKSKAPPAANACKVLLEHNVEYYCFELSFYPKRAWHGGYSYVDLIRPGVTEKFIQITMDGYERAIGAEFGKTMPGVFTDEPNINPPGRNTIRWTPDLFEQFRTRWGYDLQANLISLFEPVGDWRKVRHNYYALLLDLFIDRWAKPWNRYTEAHHIAWTGHYWEHAWPNPGQGPDNMAMYPWFHVPGIDMLFNQFREDVGAQFGNVRSVKELASAANQAGRRRTLSETYGGAGWEIRFEDMKRLGDWEYVLGVNLMNQHLAHQTIAGARKYDYPQDFTYHNPWWKHYRPLADYFGRLSLALSSGQQVNRVLVLEPTTSAWLHAAAGKPDPRMMEIGSAFQAFVTQLEAMQGEYDLGSENIMKNLGKAAGGLLTVGQRSYDLFVLPPGTGNLDSATATLLEAYLKSGGKVLAFTDPPARVDGAESDRVARLAAQYRANWQRAQSLDEPAVRQRLVSPEFRRIEGKLFHQRRKLADGQLFFFVNSSLDAPARASVELKAATLTRLDLFTGKPSAYAATKRGGELAFTLELPPAGSLLLFAGNSGTQPAVKPEAPPRYRPVEPASPLQIARISPNVLQIDYCDLKLGDSIEKDLYFYQAGEKVWKHHGLDTDPWNAAVQYKSELIGRKFPAGSGFEATFWFDADAALDRAGLRAVVERPELWKVSLNGKPVSARPGEWWLDRAFGVYDIGASTVAGRNSITLAASPMTIHSELEPVYVLGNFAVAPQARGFQLTAPAALSLGAWKDQNLPFYPDEVAYARTYSLKRAAGPYKVTLGKWSGTVAQVKVNGEAAGIIGWQPYELDISKLVRDGDNRVEVLVCGSNKNLLGPHHGNPKPGLVSPPLFRTAPRKTPPGSAYDLIGYGLLEDFAVVRSGR